MLENTQQKNIKQQTTVTKSLQIAAIVSFFTRIMLFVIVGTFLYQIEVILTLFSVFQNLALNYFLPFNINLIYFNCDIINFKKKMEGRIQKRLQETRKEQQYLKNRQKIRQSRKVFILKQKQEKSVQHTQKLNLENFLKFIFNQSMRKTNGHIFIIKTYQSLYYSTQLLKGPTQEILKRKRVNLSLKFPEKKLLLVGLNETIIYSKQNKNNCVRGLKLDVQVFFRPYLIQFLRKMNEFYNIYIFSSSKQEFCNQVMHLINKDQQLIQGYLHRGNCLESKNGLKIKDLRIIGNVPLSEIVIIDNKVHSFGLQLNNGIPILQFKGNNQDTQLFHFEKLLTVLSGSQDIRSGIKKFYKLRRLAKVPVQQIEQYVNALKNLYKREGSGVM